MSQAGDTTGAVNELLAPPSLKLTTSTHSLRQPHFWGHQECHTQAPPYMLKLNS